MQKASEYFPNDTSAGKTRHWYDSELHKLASDTQRKLVMSAESKSYDPSDSPWLRVPDFLVEVS